jgi:hypothetical protein
LHWILWSAARRLCVLVVGTLAFVAAPLAWDPRLTAMASAAYAIALSLLAAGAVALVRARRFLRSEAPVMAPAPAAAYRTSAVERDGAQDEEQATKEAKVAREAAMALLFLAMAGAMTIVAATAAAR